MGTPDCVRLFFGLCLLSAAAAAQNAVTTEPVTVYAGPDDSYPLVAQLDSDSPVQVMGCLDDWSWCDVTFADNRGWLYAPDITYEYDGGYVPLYSYAPGLGIPVVQFTIGDYWGRYYHGRPWYAQRDEWVHREPPHHRRPSGPPPSAGPPPRSARVERPGGQPERPLHLGQTGSAEPPHREAERRDEPRDGGGLRPPDPHAAEHIAPPQPARESHPGPGSAERPGLAPHEERQPAHEQPQGRAEPPRHEQPAFSPPRSEGARPQEPRHEDKPAERPGDRPKDSPH